MSRAALCQGLILVAERDAHLRTLQAHFLVQAGFSVDFVADGRSALTKAKEILPDILITEILLPKLDGLALCRQLKSDPQTATVSVLVFSILAATSRATEAGADAFLMKPLAEDRLLSMVQELMKKRQPSSVKELQ